MTAANALNSSTDPLHLQVRGKPVMPLQALSRLVRLALFGVTVGAVVHTSASQAQTAGNFPITEQQRAVAAQVASQGVLESELVANAPDHHTVVKGDTLWGISGKFLKSPWRWPALWGMNQSQIANPHLIYPGQTLFLQRKNGRAFLTTDGTRGNGGGIDSVVKLSPHIRDEGALGNDAISSIPEKDIAPFLIKPIVVSKEDVENGPRIIKTQEDRLFLGRGDKAFIINADSNVRDWNVYKAAKPIVDPDTDKPIAYQADYLGALRVTAGPAGADEVTATTVTEAKQEIGIGNRLTPVVAEPKVQYMPHAPASALTGRIAAIPGGVRETGRDYVVILNRGAKQGVEVGHVLALYTKVGDAKGKSFFSFRTEIPDQTNGLMFVFRTADNISYALVTQASAPVKVGDTFTQP